MNFFNNGWFLEMDRLTNHEEHEDARRFLKIIMNSFFVPFVTFVVKLFGMLTLIRPNARFAIYSVARFPMPALKIRPAKLNDESGHNKMGMPS